MQQGSVEAPQAVQPPAAQTVLDAEHELPIVTHLSLPGSQQSVPAQAGPVGQQNWFALPHAPHWVAPHTVPAPLQLVPCA
jgi:hypothetical protein